MRAASDQSRITETAIVAASCVSGTNFAVLHLVYAMEDPRFMYFIQPFVQPPLKMTSPSTPSLSSVSSAWWGPLHSPNRFLLSHLE
ncbi:hypothetical protein MTO96_006383 [Rhipicephalus appendiculatus]